MFPCSVPGRPFIQYSSFLSQSLQVFRFTRINPYSGVLTCILGVEHLQSMHHGTGKYVGILFAAEVESVDLPGITPLVKSLRRLVVLETFGNGTIYHHLMIK